MISARINNSIRKAVYRRDHYRCALCDSPEGIQVHHVIPKGSGGSVTSMHNLITLCRQCHANVHGNPLDPQYWSPKETAIACVEYVADLYAPGWWPYQEKTVDEVLQDLDLDGG